MKGISEKFTKRWGVGWGVTVTGSHKTFHRYEDAVRVLNYFYETGESLDIAVFDPSNTEHSISRERNEFKIRIMKNNKLTTRYVKTIKEAVELRNKLYGMEKRKCRVCGKEFWDKFNDDICNDCYMKEFGVREEEDEEEIEFNTPKEIRYTYPEKVEKEARKQGKHYADIQKEKTLSMIPKIKIPAFALRPEQKATFEALYGSNWEAFYNTI